MPVPPRRTPLYDAQARLGGRFVTFAGWEMPLQFSGILDEHRAVRLAAGLFDISHMGQVRVAGPSAAAWLDSLLTNSVENLKPGGSQYTFMLNESGGVIDDLILYRLAPEEFLLVINAAVTDNDLLWMRSRLPASGVALEAPGESRGAVALQGPNAPEIFHAAFGAPGPRRRGVAAFTWQGCCFLSAGTGYTGEQGFEIFCDAADAPRLYARLLEAGSSRGLKPCGLGSRDTLRLEMAYPLNGNDLSPQRSPVEADLALFVSFKKSARYPGREVVERHRAEGPPSLLAAIALEPGGPPPRAHYPVFFQGEQVGELSSGALSPSLGHGICLAFLPPPLARPGTALEIEVRGRRIPAKTVTKPFYNPRL